tara:strand:+ start:177 stop:497 length:321 start_codon:yes stop_codon:yes gene_type:complete
MNFLNFLSSIDPGPFFGISLFPYLAFLYWAQRSPDIPKVSLWGFKMTVVFVFMTIIFALIARQKFGGELTDIDTLHGTAESFLTISDALVALGFARILGQNQVKNS